MKNIRKQEQLEEEEKQENLLKQLKIDLIMYYVKTI